MQPAYWKIEQLPGLSKAEQTQLKWLGIKTTDSLLKWANNQSQKQALANQLRSPVQLINKWIALADLAKVPSVGCRYCGLILHSGIISIRQLAETPASFLHRQILKQQVATFQRKDLCPSPDVIQVWINEARKL